MSLNDTPSGERVHIAFFGRRNAGKSSLINAVTGQKLSIVSETKGTTTDPVYKSMELLPLGPVVMIDTPGSDDEGELGGQRVRKARQVLNKTDLAVVVIDAAEGSTPFDDSLIGLIEAKKIPYLIAFNKADMLGNRPKPAENALYVSAETGEGIHDLKERIARMVPPDDGGRRIIGDLLVPGDLAVLVVPVDAAAPKGRLILPQQQTIRDALDADAMTLVVKETGLRDALAKLAHPPAMVITDSQAFKKVAADTPESVKLTSFSILMARYKGLLDGAVDGVAAIEHLRDGDTVLISEGCTHHRQCGDIGTVKLPAWLRAHTGKDIRITTTSGTEFPDDLSPYALILHCGGCMLNAREMLYRAKCADDQGVAMTNYGVAIAYMNGILKRSLSVFPELAAKIK
ncbi:MAG: [FeFe] hydrogenase H-cluster maturation GTPase HydF [Clostridiaceae bacterium]|nr:[FeFe] hydrogenase H-cluster maturation GTPase HydF [Clostridiaceae bacterium]